MKLQLEHVQSSPASSFNIMVNPNLSDFFFWHFHPELELVFIEGTRGNRHVGEHISTFEGRDLVFIGSNIPHLNFDYGIKGPYEKIVLHLRPDFLESSLLSTPELRRMQGLFERARHAVCFGSQTMNTLGKRLKRLHLLDDFDRFVEVLRILQVLAIAEDQKVLHSHPVRYLYGTKDKQRLDRIYGFIERNYQRSISINEIADLSSLSKEAFCRYFKKMTRLTFTQFVNHYRVDVAKRLLLQGDTITAVCFECGFESLSYFNRVFKRTTGVNPTAFKKQYMSAS